MRFLTIALGGLLITTSAYASSPIGQVGGTAITKGKTSLDMRFGYSIDDESLTKDKRYQMRQFIDYGFTDWYALRLGTTQDRQNMDGLEFETVSITNRFQFKKQAIDGWDAGMRLSYIHRDGDKTPHTISTRFITQLPLNDTWQWRQNTILSHEIGEDAEGGIKFDFRNQITREIASPIARIQKFIIGVSLFNNFGNLEDLSGYSNQDHHVRPFIIAKFSPHCFLKIGIGFGLSNNSPDNTFKLAIGKSF